jgi:hypothetical protein
VALCLACEQPVDRPLYLDLHGNPMLRTRRVDAVWCSDACRQFGWREEEGERQAEVLLFALRSYFADKRRNENVEADDAS